MFGLKLIKKEELESLIMKEAGGLRSELSKISSDLALARQRVIDLEDAHEKETGIKVRVDNTVTIAYFTKTEMCLLQGVLKRYAGDSKNMGDVEFSLGLYNRMSSIIEGMEE